jgi:hypothetical protein
MTMIDMKPMSTDSLEGREVESPNLDDDLPREYRVQVHTGRDHTGEGESNGVCYQRCGGGRRIIRKQIGGN